MYNFKYEEANECLNNIFKVDKNIEEAKKMRNALNKKILTKKLNNTFININKIFFKDKNMDKRQS